MFDNLFTSSTSLWTGLISGAVLIPILIHLINLVRYKKVPFAAMDFLLKSQKRSRNYIWLKQLLLLLTRIAALVLALFLMAQVGCQQDRIARILGGRSTHHYVLLDDSFSMTDVGRDALGNGKTATAPTAFDRALSVLTSVAGRVSNRQSQKFSLVRYSAGDPLCPLEVPLSFDIENELVDSNFNRLLDETRGRLKPSNLRLMPGAVISKIAAIIDDRKDENAILYVLSDFRSKDWAQAGGVEDDLAKIRSANGAIELINCGTDRRNNLAVVDLQPASNVRVVATPLMMEVKIKNFSKSPKSKVRASIVTEMIGQASLPTGLVSETEDLPTVFIDKIEGGETVTRQFPVLFAAPGSHVVSIELQEDAVAVDNQRYSVVSIKEKSKVLLIDDADRRHASFVKLALNPNHLTGIEAMIEPTSFLRDASAEQLEEFDGIFLLDVESLDDVAVEHLHSFCTDGGGVGFFLGAKVNLSFYNRLFERFPELFPIELDQAVVIEEDPQTQTPDFSPLKHPIFAPVLNQKTSLLDLVDIEQVIVPTRRWLLSPPVFAQTIATVRGVSDRPLLVESVCGDGRVMVCTTTAGPVWNNWAKNATYLPVLLLMQDHLANGKRRMSSLTLSSELKLRQSQRDFLPKVTLLDPVAAGGPGGANLKDRTVAELTMQLQRASSDLTLRLPEFTQGNRSNLQAAGVVDLWYQSTSGATTVARHAINVDTDESALETVDSARLLTDLELANPTWVNWNEFNPEPNIRPASSLTRLCLALLVCVFAVEPLLAYLSTFHHK